MLTAVDYSFALIIAFFCCLVLTAVVIWLAKKLNILDQPKDPRKIHKKPTPLLGGLAIFISFNAIIAIYYFFSSDLIHKNILPKHLLGMLIGGLILMIGGILDDKYNLRPKLQLVFPIAAIASVIVSGIGIDWMTNPVSGGIWRLDEHVSTLFWFNGLPYKITIIADIFTMIWMMAMIYTTKLLDGLDGLVSGITIISGLFIFITALNKDIAQYDVALLSILLVGCFVGFLIFNFNPAKIFLGEGGSTYAGFMLGILSIISGSKVAVTLIVMGIPVLDVLWTVIRRLLEKKNPFTTSDKKHLHHRLLAAGFSVRRAVLFLYLITFIFGIAAILLQPLSYGNFLLIISVLVVFILLVVFLYKIKQEREKKALDLN